MVEQKEKEHAGRKKQGKAILVSFCFFDVDDGFGDDGDDCGADDGDDNVMRARVIIACIVPYVAVIVSSALHAISF